MRMSIFDVQSCGNQVHRRGEAHPPRKACEFDDDAESSKSHICGEISKSNDGMIKGIRWPELRSKESSHS